MRQIVLYIALSLLLFTGCEKTGVVDVDIPYEEYIVIQSELKSGQPFRGVTITRTIPPGTEYDIRDAELKDVVVYLKIDTIKVLPLHYTSNGIYMPLYDLQIESGTTYELFGERGDRKFYASTIVPYPPVMGNGSFNVNTGAIDVNVYSKATEVYGAIWVIGNYQDAALNYTTLSNPGESKDNTKVSTAPLPENYRSLAYDFMRGVKVYSYDTQYYKFFKSIKDNEPVNNVFVQGSGSISWNVKGNKVIGLFIGSAEGDLTHVL